MPSLNKRIAFAMILYASIVCVGCSTTADQIVTRSVASDAPAAVKLRDDFTVALPAELQGRLTQAQPLPGDRPAIVATTGQHIVVVSDRVDVAHSLMRRGALGETAILPSPVSLLALPDIRFGVLVHNHHAVERFRLIDLNGRTLLTLEDPRHFHYRLAPDGASFIGLDAGGAHTGLTAPEVIYRFFDARGTVVGEVRSPVPQSPDSEYGPDGKSFLINSRSAGLSAHDPATARRLWMVGKDIKFFAASNRKPGRVVVSDGKIRHLAELYEGGRRLWQVDLRESGAKDAVRNVAIAPSGQFAAMSSGTVLLVLDAADAKPRGIFNVADTFRINSVSVRDDGLVAVGVHEARSGEGTASTGQVFVLDRNGNVLFQRQTAHRRTNAWVPVVRFDATGQSLMVEMLESIGILTVR